MSGRNENREKDHSLLVGETLCRTAKRSTSLDLSLSEQYWAGSPRSRCGPNGRVVLSHGKKRQDAENRDRRRLAGL